jgi:hypothetical protein
MRNHYTTYLWNRNNLIEELRDTNYHPLIRTSLAKLLSHIKEQTFDIQKKYLKIFLDNAGNYLIDYNDTILPDLAFLEPINILAFRHNNVIYYKTPNRWIKKIYPSFTWYHSLVTFRQPTIETEIAISDYISQNIVMCEECWTIYGDTFKIAFNNRHMYNSINTVYRSVHEEEYLYNLPLLKSRYNINFISNASTIDVNVNGNAVLIHSTREDTDIISKIYKSNFKKIFLISCNKKVYEMYAKKLTNYRCADEKEIVVDYNKIKVTIFISANKYV